MLAAVDYDWDDDDDKQNQLKWRHTRNSVCILYVILKAGKQSMYKYYVLLSLQTFFLFYLVVKLFVYFVFFS